MPVCMVLVELAITCVHDYMVVTVKVTKIYGKMIFNRWTLAITAVPTTLTHTISDNWLRTSAVIDIYKVRARRNGYSMLIPVYILCILNSRLCTLARIVIKQPSMHPRPKEVLPFSLKITLFHFE